MQNKLLKKFFSFSYGSWIGLFLGVATTMITTRLLSPEVFGKASMFDLFLQVGLIFIVFGTDQSFTRFFYEEEEEKRGALLYNVLKLPIIAISIIVSITLLLYKPLTLYLFETVNFNFAILLVVGLTAQLFFRYGQLVVRMQQKGNLYSLIQIFQRVFNLFFIIILFYLIGEKFEVLIYSSVISLSLLVFFTVYIGREFWSVKNLKVKNTKHSQLEIIRFGAPFVLAIFITWLFESFDRIALRQWSDFNELGMYSAAMRLVALVVVLQTTFRTFWTPVSYEQFEKDPTDKKFFQRITTIVSFTMFLVAIASIMGKDIVVMLLGAQYSAAASLMPFLVFIPVMHTISSTTVVGINFYKKTKWHIPIVLISCVINIVGNWLLVPGYGALGASLSTAFAYVVFFTLRTLISLRFYHVNYPLKRIYFMVIVVSLYALYAIFSTNILVNILLGIIPICILATIYYKDLRTLFNNRRKILGGF